MSSPSQTFGSSEGLSLSSRMAARRRERQQIRGQQQTTPRMIDTDNPRLRAELESLKAARDAREKRLMAQLEAIAERASQKSFPSLHDPKPAPIQRLPGFQLFERHEAAALVPRSSHPQTDSGKVEVKLDLSHAATRSGLREWLAKENRASQVVDLLKKAPPNARLALSGVLERLLSDDDGHGDSDVVRFVTPGTVALARSRDGAAQELFSDLQALHQLHRWSSAASEAPNAATPGLSSDSDAPGGAHSKAPRGRSGNDELKITITPRAEDGADIAVECVELTSRAADRIVIEEE